MLEALIMALIWCAVVLIVTYVILWAIGMIFPAIPGQIIKLIWVIAVLICLLVLLNVLLPSLPLVPRRP
jgi:hypothetical protein